MPEGGTRGLEDLSKEATPATPAGMRRTKRERGHSLLWILRPSIPASIPFTYLAWQQQPAGKPTECDIGRTMVGER